MTQPESVLEQLVSDGTWRPDWQDVLAHSGVVKRRRLVTARRVAIAVAVAAAVSVPLAAVAAANDWWFFRIGAAPTPTSSPVVVKTGVWDGHPWQLVAYASETDGLCVSIVPGTDSASTSGAMSCAPIEGVARTAKTKPGAADMKITYMSGSGGAELPKYVVGPVTEEATTVAIRFIDGTTVRTRAIAGPPPLEHVGFYAVQLSGSQVGSPTTRPTFSAAAIKWVAGLDQAGDVVACLVPAAASNGNSPLSACR
jgi:hypothetical protein